MQRFDRTGPQGMGPMTGGGRGYCAVPGSGWAVGTGRRGLFRGPIGAPGRGRGGIGMGRGVRGGWGYPGWGAAPVEPYGAPMSEEQELEQLRQQEQFVEGELEEIKRRINGLNS